MPATNVEKLLRALYEQEVEFIIIGGAAAVLHGSAYVTADLDICYSREKENLKRLAAPYLLQIQERQQAVLNYLSANPKSADT